MTADTTGFTAVVCNRCAATDPGWTIILKALRGAVRRCPHGVLVVAECLAGRCTAHTGGVMVLVQRCSTDRSPIGPVQWIGPLGDAAGAAELCDWLEYAMATSVNCRSPW